MYRVVAFRHSRLSFDMRECLVLGPHCASYEEAEMVGHNELAEIEIHVALDDKRNHTELDRATLLRSSA